MERKPMPSGERSGAGEIAGRAWVKRLRLGVVLTTGACAAAAGAPAQPAQEGAVTECEDLQAAPIEEEVGRLAGEYDLVLVATEGSRSGDRAEGRLELWPQDPSLHELVGPGDQPIGGATQPLVGTLEGELEAIGAAVPGDPTSTDPEAPGVALLVMEGGGEGSEVLLRIGSEANVRGRVAFDEAFTVLWVRGTDDDGFYGGWESGGGDGDAGGHFCALRP